MKCMKQRNIYEHRLKIGRTNHNQYVKDLADLDEKLVTTYKSKDEQDQHPYTATEKLYNALMDNVSYRKGGHGPKAIIGKDSKYLYRITSLNTIIRNNDHYNINSKYFDEILEPHLLYMKLVRSGKSNKWVPFTDICNNFYNGHRGFTWWTQQEITPITASNIISLAHKLGICNDWLCDHSLLLKCDLDKIDRNSISVPTAIDAYDQIIFKTLDFSIGQEHGETINLADITSKGLKEFTIKQIAAEAVQFHLVKLQTQTELNRSFPNTNLASLEEGCLLDKLLSFYDYESNLNANKTSCAL